MLHFGAIALSAVMAAAIGVMPLDKQHETQAVNDEIVYYEDTGMYGDGGSTSYTATENIYYTSKTLTATYSLAFRFPLLTYSPALGACGAVAGGNVVAFYDRYDENLIPNHVSGTPIGNTYSYSVGDQYTNAAITQLYEYMTGGGYGMTEDQFKNGLTRYCNEKGRSVSFTSCMSNGSFDYSKMKTNMQTNQPIIFFLSGYNVMKINSSNGYDALSYRVSTATHVMIGFGYSSYTYETSGGVKSYDLVSVSSGLENSLTNDLFDIRYQTQIDDALAVNIY